MVNSATKSSSIILSLTGIGLIAIPMSTATACGLSIGSKVIYEVTLKKYSKQKKQNEKNQQTIEPLNELYRKTLQDNVSDKNEYESLFIFITEYRDETKNETFF